MIATRVAETIATDVIEYPFVEYAVHEDVDRWPGTFIGTSNPLSALRSAQRYEQRGASPTITVTPVVVRLDADGSLPLSMYERGERPWHPARRRRSRARRPAGGEQ